LVVGLCAAGLSAWMMRDPSSGGRSGIALDAAPTGAGALARRAPTAPPARICGSPGLVGPERRPPGFRRVTTAQSLEKAVNTAAAGTRFWLTTGVHTLGDGEYDQVAPKDGMVFLGAPGAVLDGRRTNHYAFTGQARRVTIAYLTIQNFGTSLLDNLNEGVVNHDTGDGWNIRWNTVRWNGGAGVFLGDGNRVTHNCLRANGQYGFSAYEDDQNNPDGSVTPDQGVRDVVLAHNEIAYNNTGRYDLTDPSCGCTGGGKFWAVENADVTHNWVHHNHGVGLWADTNNTGFLISHNYIGYNDAEGVMYETSYNAEISFNTFKRNAIPRGPTDDGFPIPALYLSEAGSDSRAGREYGDEFRVIGNRFIDNWGGVVGWENADRFAGSPANSSTGTTTLVNPTVATVENCGNPDLIGTKPYIDDCRWKTQHLRVQGNLFRFTPSHLGPTCTTEELCGFNGLFSQYGSSPEWSPYQDTVVMDDITFAQDNRWLENRYEGPWNFMAWEMGTPVPRSTWRGPRYQQDAGSTFD
jgi:hypothetical protein